MIRLKDLIKELNDGEIEELELSKVKSLITQTFKKKYPEAKLYFEEDDYLYVSTDEEDPTAASMWGEGSRDNYYLAFNLYAEGDVLNLVVGNATANKYKGVTTDIFKALFDFGTKKYKPINQKILYIEDDRSDSVWEKVAKKLGVDYEES
jgi:hypothetical protein